MENQVSPNKGKQLKVQPIKDPEKVAAIKRYTQACPRNFLLFTMGINNGIRASDLCVLQVWQVRGLKAGDTITIRERKTKKDNVLVINKPVEKALRLYFKEYRGLEDEDYLFFSQRQGYKGRGHMGPQHVGDLVQEWCKAVGLNRGRYGCHTLRKTFGYMQRKLYGTSWELLAARYNHSSPAVTRAYLGIAKEEVITMLNNPI